MPKPLGYPHAPLPLDVLKARGVIHTAVDLLTSEETIALADYIRKQMANSLMNGIKNI